MGGSRMGQLACLPRGLHPKIGAAPPHGGCSMTPGGNQSGGQPACQGGGTDRAAPGPRPGAWPTVTPDSGAREPAPLPSPVTETPGGPQARTCTLCWSSQGASLRPSGTARSRSVCGAASGSERLLQVRRLGNKKARHRCSQRQTPHLPCSYRGPQGRRGRPTLPAAPGFCTLSLGLGAP